jgi:solute carrier family 35 protein F1/2
MHVAGVCACLAGLVCIVLSDARDGDEDNFSNPVLGDFLCLGGAMLYGTSNVLQEFLVKKHSRVSSHRRLPKAFPVSRMHASWSFSTNFWA